MTTRVDVSHAARHAGGQFDRANRVSDEIRRNRRTSTWNSQNCAILLKLMRYPINPISQKSRGQNPDQFNQITTSLTLGDSRSTQANSRFRVPDIEMKRNHGTELIACEDNRIRVPDSQSRSAHPPGEK